MKTVDEIYREMLAVFTRETGMTLHESSEMAVRFYALAAQIYGLYQQNQWTLAQCFPQTAMGDYLEYHAKLRGLTRNSGVCAQGTLRFSVSEAQSHPLSIPVGTVCMTAGLVRFETTQEEVLAAGSLFVDVPATAVEVGTCGNVPEGMVRVMSVAPLGITSCTNPTAFTGGAEQEEDERLRARILDTYQRMPNGANAAYYEREALSFSQVAAVNVIGRSRGIGTVDVVIASPSGEPSTELLETVKEHLNQQREIAVDLQVLAPTKYPVDLQIQIAVQNGENFASVKEEVEHCLTSYFDGKILGQALLRAKLGELVYALDGVKNYQILSPTQDVAIRAGQLPVLQSLSVEELS